MKTDTSKGISDAVRDRCSHYFLSPRFTKVCNVSFGIVSRKGSGRGTVTVDVGERTLSALLDAKASNDVAGEGSIPR